MAGHLCQADTLSERCRQAQAELCSFLGRDDGMVVALCYLMDSLNLQKQVTSPSRRPRHMLVATLLACLLCGAAIQLNSWSLSQLEQQQSELVLIHSTILRSALGEDALVESTRLLPSIRDGEVTGYEIFGIEDDSAIAALGFRNGDTIHQINDMALMTWMVQPIDSRLPDEFTVHLTRNGQGVMMQVSLI